MSHHHWCRGGAGQRAVGGGPLCVPRHRARTDRGANRLWRISRRVAAPRTAATRVRGSQLGAKNTKKRKYKNIFYIF